MMKSYNKNDGGCTSSGARLQSDHYIVNKVMKETIKHT